MPDDGGETASTTSHQDPRLWVDTDILQVLIFPGKVYMKKLHIATVVVVSLIAWLCGCTSTGPIAAGQTSLQDALAHEATLTDSYAVAAEDDFFSATVSGSAMPTVTPHEGVYQVTVPINAQIPAECFVYRNALDSATTLRSLLSEMLTGFSRTSILKIDAGTFEELPYLYQESLYITEQDAAGVLKGIVVPIGSSTLACLHDEPGYSETFRQMAGSLAGSMRIGNAAPESWKFQEILVWQLRDLNVGYTLNRVGKAADGEIKSIAETALIIPRKSDETMTHDGYDVTYEKENGELVTGRYAEAENGNITLSIRLDKTARSSYRVSGQFQGKEIDSQLNSATDLVGPYYQYTELIKAANPDDGKPRALSAATYIPSANPLQTIAIEAQPTGQRIGDLPEYAMLFSGMKAISVIDDNGQKEITVQMGPLELQLSRVYTDGHI